MRGTGDLAALYFYSHIHMEVTFDLTTPQGAPAEALNAVIEARRKELGETAMQSCVAMAEGILRSLRV